MQSTARQLRAYPNETIARYSGRMEECLAKCQGAAQKAQEYYTATNRVVGEMQESYLWVVLLVSVVSSMTMALALVLLPKLFT